MVMAIGSASDRWNLSSALVCRHGPGATLSGTHRRLHVFSQTVEYALRAMVYLAYNPGRPYTAQHIADSTKVPPRYMSKVLMDLSKSKLLDSQRGPHGIQVR